MIKYESFTLLPFFETNTYLVWDDLDNNALLIDPSYPSPDLLRVIEHKKIDVRFIINTHGHADHIGGNYYFKSNLKCNICIHEYDALMLNNPDYNLSSMVDYELFSTQADITLFDNHELNVGNVHLRIIHTPGHTQGSITILIDNFLFTGDTLFFHDIGRTDLPGGDDDMILHSITKKIFLLPDDTIVLPGHGLSSTIKEEKSSNPYLAL